MVFSQTVPTSLKIVTEINPNFTKPVPLKGHLFGLQIVLHQGLEGLLTASVKVLPLLTACGRRTFTSPCHLQPGAQAREPVGLVPGSLGSGACLVPGSTSTSTAWSRGARWLELPGRETRQHAAGRVLA